MALTQVKTSGLADDAVTGAKIADDTVAEANMANDAISLAELKAGTDGQIITYDASGNPVAVGPGTDGQVLTSTGAGSPPAFEALPASGPSLANDANNRVITGTGSGLNGEANLVFDGSKLGIGETSPSTALNIKGTSGGGVTGIKIENTANEYAAIELDADRSGANSALGIIRAKWNGNENAAIYMVSGSDTTNKDDAEITFQTRPSGGDIAERVRIDSTGDVLIGRTSSSTSHPLCVQSDSNAETIAVIGRSSDDISAIGFFENDTTTALGEIQYRQDHVNVRHRVGDIRFATGGTTERVRIHGDGHISQYATPYGYINYASDGSASDNGEFALEEQTSHHDEGGMNIGATNRMTVPYTGIYLVAASIGIDKNASTGRPRLNLKVNGSKVLSQELQAGVTSGGWNTRAFSMILSLSANDYLDITAVGKCDGGNYAKSQIVLLYGK